MAKCSACNSFILMGGTEFADRVFCGPPCVSRFKIALTDQFIPPQEIEKVVKETFDSPCPTCSGAGPLDVYTADTVTGMLIAYQTQQTRAISCVGCGRKQKLKATLHCAFLGWWGVKAAIHNIVYIPKNLIGAAMISSPSRPSDALTSTVKELLADRNMHAMLAGKTE